MCRLLEWLPDVQEDVGWIRDQILKILHHILSRASKSVSRHVSARYLILYLDVPKNPPTKTD